MKPFDLEKALAGDPVITRDGRPVKIAGYNEDAKDGHIVGWINGVPEYWDKNGIYSPFTKDSLSDLFMYEESRKVYFIRVNILHSSMVHELKYQYEFESYEEAENFNKNYFNNMGTVHEITIIE